MTDTTRPALDVTGMYMERARMNAEKLIEEALQVLREHNGRCGYARDLLRGADDFLEALERVEDGGQS